MFTKNKTPSAPGQNAGAKPSSGSPMQNAIKSASTKPTARSAPSIISADMAINGSVTSDGEMQIDGKIDGDITAVSITIGQTGTVQGEVKAQTVIVRGRIIGSIRARKVELETGAHVEGDIVHASLSIQSNAVFQGQVMHSDNPMQTQTGAEPASQQSSPAVSTPTATTTSASSPTSTT